MIETALIVFFPMLMIYSACSDLFSMTISNKVSIALIAGFFFFAYAVGLPTPLLIMHGIMFVLVLMLGIALFATGAAGGGDVKLAAATALWFGFDFTLTYLILASLLGFFLTLFILFARGLLIPERFETVDWIVRLHRMDKGIPYGIALGTAGVIVFPQTWWMQRAIELSVGG